MNDVTENQYVFILGREQDLALVELEAVLRTFCFSFDIYKITGNTAFAKIDNFSKEDAKRIIDVLAGTIKVYKLVSRHHTEFFSGSRNEKTLKQIQRDITDFIVGLTENRENKLDFGISDYTKGLHQGAVNRLGIEVKKSLKKEGRSVRFVALTEGNELSSIQTLKNQLVDKGVEIGIFSEGFGELIALNNPEKWAKIDYGKPASDKYSGMLPPRLARTMVNISLGITKPKCQMTNFGIGYLDFDINDIVVVDPFCGSGNILLEALQLGLPVIGSDLSLKAVNDTKMNLDWFEHQFPVSSSQFSVFQADATSEEYIAKLKAESERLKAKEFVFVTEPFLGKPKKFKSSYNATIGEYKDIKELYLDFLKNIITLSSPDQVEGRLSGLTRGSKIEKQSVDSRLRGNDTHFVICLVFPLVETQEGKRFSLFLECVDEIKKLGYTQTRNSYIYGREYQVVKREIVLLKFEALSTKFKTNQKS